MVKDYDDGFSGQIVGADVNSPEYLRGEADRRAGRKHPNALDTTGVYKAGQKAGRIITKDPAKALRDTIRTLIFMPVLIGLIAAALALVLSQTAAVWGLVAFGVTFVLYLTFSVIFWIGAMLGALRR